MIPKYAHSLGGKVNGEIQRKKALENYYKNPKFCKNCKNIIEIRENQKVAEVKLKKFCNRTCAGTFNNKDRKKVKKDKVLKEPKIPFKWLINKTKIEIFTNHKNWQSARTSIRRHAKFIYDSEVREKICKNCGYNKHIEICHIKSVSSFQDDIKISEINRRENLIALCPNCHWEFDNGILKL